MSSSGSGYDNSPDAYPGAGPTRGLLQAEFACLQRLQDWLNTRDAANECVAHGRLPGDRSPACGCWGDEGKKEAA